MKEAIILAFCFVALRSFAQDKAVWNNKKCAVALTYDDALNVHLDNAIPLLDSLDMKATFYLSGSSGVLNNRLNQWRSIAKNGHELGNHTLYHPCIGNRPGREFVKPDYDLGKYSIRRITDEIKMTNTLLKAIDGKNQRTFAYPCGDTRVGDSSYIESIMSDFIAARGVKNEIHSFDNVDLSLISCYSVNGQTGQQLIEVVKRAMAANALVVFLFHGVGGEHSLNVSLHAHRELLQFLQQHEKDLWVAPMIEIAQYITSRRGSKK